MGKVVYFVVGDTKLNSGNGIEVADIEEMKAQLMTLKIEGDWQLVISMHGAEDVIVTQGGFLKTRPKKGVYDASTLKTLFSDDADYQKWLTKYGPAWTTLNACQVHKKFEQAVLDAFNKPKSSQNSQGLGAGCRPATLVQTYVTEKDQEITTRAQWRKLSKTEQAAMLEALSELNDKFGYFGGRPVKKSLVLDYYFDEPPKGGWPVVTVSHNRADTGISFYNRTQNARFLTEKCSAHMGPMRGHEATAPPVRE